MMILTDLVTDEEARKKQAQAEVSQEVVDHNVYW